MIRQLSAFGLLCAVGLGALSVSAPAQAAGCSATVEANDAMQFSTRALSVPASCKEFEVTLKHTGQLPVVAMGHNFVVGKTADIGGINAEGMAAGAENDYVKPGDARVIAASSLVGGGQSTTVKIPVGKLKAGEDYTFVCTFPGHAAIMRGTLTLGQ
ncbi:azurin [Luteimonas sp. RD2P54]|uniref:Azurin n=1 Tax=Luteimonas endophytica TaxID=3042023 RepID=A0ABT6J5Y1_9GAMM|nr:azurin [Luteimonas endophytica]MDH5822236.1 azurin [Luteimonas endophytica]